MGRIAKSQQQARAKARQRRIALDHDRAIRGERVEAAAGEVFLALAERADAWDRVQAAEVRVGDALQRILAEGIKADGVAQLRDLPVGEVHRLRRAAQTVHDSRGNFDPAGLDPAGLDPVGSPEVTLRPPGDAQARRLSLIHI